MPGYFTAKALIMLNFGTNVLHSYGCCSVPLRACVEFNACASKRALARNNFGDEGLFERGAYFSKTKSATPIDGHCG